MLIKMESGGKLGGLMVMGGGIDEWQNERIHHNIPLIICRRKYCERQYFFETAYDN